MSIGAQHRLAATRRRAGAFAAFAALVLGGVSVVGLADDDDRVIREALASGAVVPLDTILARVAEDHDGSVVKVELEREGRGGDKRWVYEIKLLTADGVVFKLEYDAATTELIKVKGRRDDKDKKRD